MAAGDNSDLFMMFVPKKDPIVGEGGTDLVPSDSRLLKGFQKNRIIEIDSFSFAVGINDGSANKPQGNTTNKPPSKPAQLSQQRIQQLAQQLGHQTPDAAAAAGMPIGGPANFEAWRAGTQHNKYPVSVQPITFTRGVDRSSLELLRYCIESTSFQSATLVKRKAVGGPASGEVYLRMDFDGVLITDIAWSNDNPVKETCRFISRAITVTYRPQLPTGKLGAIKQGFWSMLPWEHEVSL